MASVLRTNVIAVIERRRRSPSASTRRNGPHPPAIPHRSSHPVCSRGRSWRCARYRSDVLYSSLQGWRVIIPSTAAAGGSLPHYLSRGRWPLPSDASRQTRSDRSVASMKYSTEPPRHSSGTDNAESGLSPQRSDLTDNASRELTETFATHCRPMMPRAFVTPLGASI